MLRFLFLIFLLTAFPSWASPAVPHAYSSFDPSDLAWVRQQIKSNDERLRPAYRELLLRADRALARPPKTVIDKRGIASSDDKNDFYSVGKYSWPDENAGTDASYIRRDGQRNPESQSEDYDKKNFNESVRIVNALALAYYFSGNKAYATRAADYLRAWFINPRTRMNPNLRHAAVLLGKNDGSYGGIIEGVVLIEMLDYVALLDDSGALSESDKENLRSWFGQLSDWLVQSEFGKQEARMQNNHGSWYNAQVMAFSLYSGNTPRARTMIKPSKMRLQQQFAADGSMPEEMSRADSAMYSIYGLRSFVTLARLTDKMGDSLWNVEVDGLPVLRRALMHLAPFYSGKQEWESGSIHRGIDQYAAQTFRLGARAYHTNEFNDVLSHLIAARPDSNRYAYLLGPPASRSNEIAN